MDMTRAPDFVLNEIITIDSIAQSIIKKSQNPLGIDWSMKRFTLYYGVRLQQRKNKPDKLIFLERPSTKSKIFDHPVVHTANGTLFKTTLPPYLKSKVKTKKKRS
ncbi:hypothetical protein EhVM1_000295 [Emiliania huxleyi virus M1]|nr:hypothetical protein EhVM1_000295 [Emiliania huxleyi virus M1]